MTEAERKTLRAAIDLRVRELARISRPKTPDTWPDEVAVVALLETGPLAFTELMEKGEIPQGRLERALRKLRARGAVRLTWPDSRRIKGVYVLKP